MILLIRASASGTEITVPPIHLVVAREREILELQCPSTGSFVSLRLRSTVDTTLDSERTRVAVTVFGAGRIHPSLAAYDNAAVIAWVRAGLTRVAEAVQGAPTSILINGEDSATRLQIGIARQLVTTGVVRSFRFDRGVKQLGGLAKWGFNLAGGYAAAAAYTPKRLGLLDPDVGYTFSDVHQRTHRLAAALATLGLGARTSIGLLARNSAPMVEIMVAAGKVGIDTVLLNTGLSAGQLEEVVQRHGLAAVFRDDEYDHLLKYVSPLFHTWGLAALQISTPIRASVVLPERFDAEDTLRLIENHRVSALIVVPVMINRILDLPPRVLARYDCSSLRIVASCGAPLDGSTVQRFQDTLYNVYGSTEVSWATIADPADLRAAPTTAGRPLFDGYTDATPPAEAEGMLDTGDLGFIDADGLVFVAGRDDEMIISGGENVFPRPVEEALAHLPQVSEVAVVGVPDREFGQRLAAFVVTREGLGLDRDMVRNYIRHRLSRFPVPRDATGKILKRTLVQPS
ncbi:AMP-binding protein [Nocardia sp. NPDC050712]|uniref:AMP-binding protein n=1 Tax=Nocardia sp. NPDC050712 TaxID=3155518 RepID=UPI0033FE0A06